MTALRPILLADDSEQDVELALAALKRNNFANPVVVANDGVEVLDYFHRRGRFAGLPPGNPVVVLLDLKMPRKDGLEALADLKGNPAFKSVPVVMLTSSRQETDLVKSYNLGANAYVVKPVEFAEFVDAIRQTGAFWAVVNEPPP